jgi:hypothetical protein
MASAMYRQRHFLPLGELKGSGHVGRASAAYDYRRMQIESPVED